MNNAEIDYHQTRRVFVVIPKVGVIVCQTGKPWSHRELLEKSGVSPLLVNNNINTALAFLRYDKLFLVVFFENSFIFVKK